MEHTPEKSSDFVKRVLFDNGGENHAGPIRPGEVATANAERQGAAGEAQADDGCHRSESHSSMSSAGGALASPSPATPRLASGGSPLSFGGVDFVLDAIHSIHGLVMNRHLVFR